jgi:ABC-type cobalamin/Fe3+-siderophores transport system ATPase subunit
MEPILSIPRISDEPLELPFTPGRMVFVVGPNGSGKSALIQHFVASLPSGQVKRIAAHRQLSLHSSSIDMTAASRRQFGSSLEQWDRTPEHRWMEYDQHSRLSSVLFDLMAMEHNRARRVTDLVDAKDATGATKLADKVKSPFLQINRLLRDANLTVSIECRDDEELVARREDAGEPYSIAKMSDGERSAVLMAAEVLTVQPGTILLVDEPERHLHRSIIDPLLSALFDERSDCTFVVSTHEVELPMSYPDSTVLITRACAMNGDVAAAWDIQMLKGGVDHLPDDLKRSILGSRRRILFIEGKSHSLDKPLYEALFPGISVVAKGTAQDVIAAVKGLRGSATLHHTEAFGLIDKDFRNASEISQLKEDGIFALGVYSAESLYYCHDAIAAIACDQAKSYGLDPDELIMSARHNAFQVLDQDPSLNQRMASRRSQH